MGNGGSSSARNANLTVAQSSSSGSLQPLARFLTKEMRLVARKSVLRLSPHVKHSHCRACSTVLQAGVSCTVRVKGKKNGRRVITTCLFCGAQTRTMANPNHQLFVDKPEHTTISQNEE
ncbi:Ribonuclease P protein subunit p21 [Coemansia sp. RSA 2610]|nr:Ribonuclease P protein subunit p21 [Coemansia sp. RSA 2705]KAJ2369762.1 Ribonuclease P protein subunit p21 [Coemansia sp. RSA 2610]